MWEEIESAWTALSEKISLLIPLRVTNFPLKTKGKGKNLTCVLIPGTSQNIIPMLFPLPQVTTAIIEYSECWQALLFLNSSPLNCVWFLLRFFFSGFGDRNGVLLFFLEMCRLTFYLGLGSPRWKLLSLLNKHWAPSQACRKLTGISHNLWANFRV